MSSRSLNKVQLIGNLTRDPELRYTPQGTAVCTLGVATNRSWTTESGEKREETEFHRVVAWNKLAELCSQLLFKGRKVYVEGRLQTRAWTAQDGSQRQSTEVVIEEMIILDSRQAEGAVAVVGTEPVVEMPSVPEEKTTPATPGTIVPVEETPVEPETVVSEPTKKVTKAPKSVAKDESTDLQAGDIPF